MKRWTMFALAVAATAACQGFATPPPPATGATPPPRTPASPRAGLTPGVDQRAKSAVSSAVSAWSSHDPRSIAALYAPDAVRERLGPEGWQDATGRDAIRREAAAVLAAFPDLALGVTRVLAQDNRLVIQWIVAGTNTGPFLDHPATGKKMGVHGASVVELASSGLVQRERVYADDAAILAQLGEAPPGVLSAPVALVPIGEPEWIASGSAPDEAANGATLDAYLHAVIARDTARAGSLLADDVVQHSDAFPAGVSGKAALLRLDEAILAHVGQASVTVSSTLSAGNRVALETVVTAASGKGIHQLDVARVEGGKVGELDVYGNGLETARVLGQ